MSPLAGRLARGAGLTALGIALAAAPLPALAATAAAAAVLAVPALGVAAAAWAVPFGGLRTLPIGPGALTATPLLLALAAVPWACAALARRRLPDVRVPVMGSLAVFAVALMAAAWRAPDAARAGVEIARWIELALALALTVGVVRGSGTLRVVLVSVLLAGAAEAVVGVRMAAAGTGPEAFAVIGAGFSRAYGTFGQPNPFAGYMNLVWPLGAALVLAGPTDGLVRGRRTHAGRPGLLSLPGLPARPGLPRRPGLPSLPGLLLSVVALAAAGSCVLALGLSWSRGGWLAAAAGGACMAAVWLARILRPPVGRRAIGVLSLGLALGLAVLASGGARLPGAAAARLGSVADTFAVWGVADAEVDDANFATIERVAHWEAAAAMWADRPWLGQGPGQYEIAYARYRLPRWGEALGHAHNAYLHVLAEAGIVGLAGFLVFLLGAAHLALRAALRPVSPLHGALGLGLVGVLGALACHSLVDNLFVHDLTIHLGLVLGLVVAAGRSA